MSRSRSVGVVAVCGLAAWACLSCEQVIGLSSLEKGNEDAPAAGGAASAGGSAGATGGGSGASGVAGAAGTGGGPTECAFADEQDHDGDGYSYVDGDCNDCDPETNPGAIDLSGGAIGVAGVDENCDGVPDDEPASCDFGIDIADLDGFSGARALGLCRTAEPDAVGKDRTWGVLSARYVKVDGTDGTNALQHGVLPGFGAANVQHGAAMLVLSSGTARAPGQPGWESPQGATMGTRSNPPPGYPKESPACPGVITGEVYDNIAFELRVRVPKNARSYSFDFNFYSSDFPQFVCSEYNDFFVTLVSPPPLGQADQNISLDQDDNPISVNNSLLRVCIGQAAGGKAFECPLGPGLLENTGFTGPLIGAHAATGWLQTRAPVEPGSEITIRFGIWDSGDPLLDSTVLIDHFQWSPTAVPNVATTPVANPN